MRVCVGIVVQETLDIASAKLKLFKGESTSEFSDEIIEKAKLKYKTDGKYYE